MSKPKAVKQPPPAPPPVTASGKDAAYEEMEQRKKQRGRAGYQKTLLDSSSASAGLPKRTLLG